MFPGLTVEHFKFSVSRLVILAASVWRFFRYRAEKQTDRQTPLKNRTSALVRRNKWRWYRWFWRTPYNFIGLPHQWWNYICLCECLDFDTLVVTPESWCLTELYFTYIDWYELFTVVPHQSITYANSKLYRRCRMQTYHRPSQHNPHLVTE